MKFSDNVASVAESGTIAFFARMQQLRAEGKEIVSLLAGELQEPSPEPVGRAGIDAINQDFTKYTLNQGIPELRAAICDKLRRDNNLHYEPNQVLVSSGSKQALFNVLYCLCGKGDEVIVISPYYSSYPEMVRLCGATPVFVHAHPETGFQPTEESVRNAIADNTRAIIVNTPNNPTGVVYSRETMEMLCRVCLETETWLISDEIYEKILFGPVEHLSPASICPESSRLCVVVNGFSKSYAMTGWRIGYCAGPEELIEEAALVQSHTTNNACSISQKAAVAALKDGDAFISGLLPGLEEKKNLAYEILASIPGVECPDGQGAFYLFPSVRKLIGKTYEDRMIRTATDIAVMLLEEKQVAVVPGTAFGTEDYIRISYSTDRASVEAGCRRTKEMLELLK